MILIDLGGTNEFFPDTVMDSENADCCSGETTTQARTFLDSAWNDILNVVVLSES